MKFSSILCLGAATAATARTVPLEGKAEKFLIKTSETDSQWVTQEQKWALRREGKKFIDKTYSSSVGKTNLAGPNTSYTYPTEATQQDAVNPLLKKLSKDSMKKHLTKFSSFHNRYYKSDTGKQSSEWLLGMVQDVIDGSGIEGASVKPFKHPWVQNSIIATIPGKSDKTIVLGSHQDSINHQAQDPSTARAPGADDNGSGSMTILEALTAYVQDPKVKAGEAANTVEFHWYSAEEEGLLGSQAIFKQYEQQGRSVAAMLAQDMTGYTKGTVEAGEPISLGIITDYVNKDLTAFLKVMIAEYCTIPAAESKCGYACSDHASANEAGYPSSFVFESKMGNDSPYIHTAQDTLDTINFNHMVEHARLTLGFTYELAFATDL